MSDKECRGIRGATTAAANTSQDIKAATREMLISLVEVNDIKLEDIASAFFTVTMDLNAEFPAVAARELGWQYVPMMCCTEIGVPGALARCVRVMLHVNTSKTQAEIKHVYLREALRLRPDLLNH